VPVALAHFVWLAALHFSVVVNFDGQMQDSQMQEAPHLSLTRASHQASPPGAAFLCVAFCPHQEDRQNLYLIQHQLLRKQWEIAAMMSSAWAVRIQLFVLRFQDSLKLR
jgi:hypothetical protein